jgi:carbon-monoxide dehydrogenase large subunit
VWRAIQDARAGASADPWREPPAVFATLPVRSADDAVADEGTI